MNTMAAWLFASSEYLPHGYCISWSSPLIGTIVVSDLVIAASYFSIPLALWTLAGRRPDLPFRALFVLFGALVIACGTTHILDVVNLWQPVYRLDAAVKVVTAAISLLMAIMLWPLLPRALALPSTKALAEANARLEEEARLRQAAETAARQEHAALQAHRDVLEMLVAERTASLIEINSRLEAEKTVREQLLRDLQASEARAQARADELAHLLDVVPVGVWFAREIPIKHISGNRLAETWLQMPPGSNMRRNAADESEPAFRMFKDGAEIALDNGPMERATRGITTRDFEFDFVLPEGSRRRMLCNAVPVLDVAGRISGAVAACMDVTERHVAEEERLEAMRAAEHANQAKSRFLAAASHDLRQPLSALSIYAGSLKSHVAPAGQPMLANMKECIGSLSELLSDLLDLSKLEAGIITPHIRDFALHDILAHLTAAHTPEAALNGLHMRCCCTPRVVRSDPVLLQRIVGNYLTNAIRYTRQGGVLVGCRRHAGKTWLEVWDTGIGIPADKTKEIFEEFRQLNDDARTRGSGLGLAIVARTAALLDLQIRVRSCPGRGSMFAIELPAGEASLAKEAHTARQSPSPCRSLRVALTEDSPSVREALVRGLQDAGHHVRAAGTGAELIEALGQERPDIVVSDYRLAEGETGYQVITALRAMHGAALPALLITGDTDPEVVRSMADRGIVVLHKPLDLETLLAYVEDAAMPVLAAW